MEEKREGDKIICTIYTFFFLCLIGGGSFLFMYMISDQPQEWHMVVGMTLVGLPWAFWILTCAYTLAKHRFLPPNYVVDRPSSTNNTSFKATAAASSDKRLSGDMSSTDSNSPDVKFAVTGDEKSQDHGHGRHKPVDELPI